ncbi:MAG: hypothetical protein ACYS6K_15825 [Planctomycetota bacterium]|jgi:hypothetical protein
MITTEEQLRICERRFSVGAIANHGSISDDFFLKVTGSETIEGQVKFVIYGAYNQNTEAGRRWYQETLPTIKDNIRNKCVLWTKQGYPISLNDFVFEIQAIP